MVLPVVGLSSWPSGKESTCHSGDTGDGGSITGSGRSPGGGNDNPLQNSCLDNCMKRRAWWAIVHGITVKHSMYHAHTH